MDKKTLLFIGLSLLIIPVGLLLVLRQDRKLLTDTHQQQPSVFSINNVKAFNELEEKFLQEFVGDSVRILFRFPPGTCNCLEPEFAEAVNFVKTNFDENRVFTVISSGKPKDVYFFRERTKITGAVFSATDTLQTIYDASHNPYACIIFPDLTAHNMVTVNPRNIHELISHAKEIINE